MKSIAQAVKNPRRFWLVLLCLVGLPALLLLVSSKLAGPTYEFSNGRIVDRQTGLVVDTLSDVRFVCLIGKPMTEVAGKVDGRDMKGCPTINDQGIIVGRAEGCSFYEIVNHRVLDEYDYQCRDKARNLKQFDRHGISTLYFDDQVSQL